MTAYPHHYQVLDVPPDATPEQITVAYRRASNRWHPDRKEGNSERMAMINAAYEVLSDPEARRRYDGDDDAFAEAVEQQVAAIFQNAIGAVLGGHTQTRDIVRIATTHLDTAIEKTKGALRDTARQREKLQALRTRVVHKNGGQLFTTVVQQELDDVDMHAANGEARLRLLQAVRLAVLEYHDNVSELVFPTPGGLR